ncbi:MAG: UDP-N-acetylmuramoyl-L-alanyl-D-glutamate--2,6-diaminopimelate ligase [Spirochaetales bacterium]|nr:UDP-N-acetylmuramoyl-L-alanyl-D-glutamate--2,6-diaminopimelate ligase [Spirochaetales bacterium]
MEIYISDLSAKIYGFEASQDWESIEVCGLAYDSRDVREGFAFFALTGIHTDGHSYIEETLKKGASVIVYSQEVLIDFDSWGDVCFVKVSDTRQAMAVFSSLFYGQPEKEIKIIGITGTDGKSSTVSFVYQLLNSIGVKAGFLSTVEYDNGCGVVANPFRQSTPESTEIHKFLRQMVENGCKVAVVEATSHGLSAKTSRLSEILFDVGISTNITSEHLEFHGTVENYINDKANLFRQLRPGGLAIINRDDERSKRLFDVAGDKALGYSTLDPEADYFAKIERLDDSGSEFSLNCKDSGEKSIIRLNIPGRYNVENIVSAIAAVQHIARVGLDSLARVVEDVEPVKGRLNIVNLGQNFTLVIDYAHTPGSFEKVLPAMKSTCRGRLIVVFGSGGERDIVKRPVQGEIASKYCDIIILADEDPRLEDSMKILNDIAAGVKGKVLDSTLFLIPDRADAIEKAISLAKAGDTILLLGKGHESSIIKKEGKTPWDELEVAKRLILKYKG